MSLMETIAKAIAEAMKARDQERLGPLRMLKAAMMNREVEKARALQPDEELAVVATLVKQRRESIEQFQKGGREDLVARERGEIGVLGRSGDGGVQECGYAQNCVEVCPKDIPLTRSIAQVGGEVMKQALGDFFRK